MWKGLAYCAWRSSQCRLCPQTAWVLIPPPFTSQGTTGKLTSLTLFHHLYEVVRLIKGSSDLTGVCEDKCWSKNSGAPPEEIWNCPLNRGGRERPRKETATPHCWVAGLTSNAELPLAACLGPQQVE